MSNNKIGLDILKLFLLVIIIILGYRLYLKKNNDIIDNFVDLSQYNDIFNKKEYGNIVKVNRLGEQRGGSHKFLNLRYPIRLESLRLKLIKPNDSPILLYFKDNRGNYRENYIVENGKMKFNNKNEIVLLDPVTKDGKKIVTDSIKIKYLNEDSVRLNTYQVFGMQTSDISKQNFMNNVQQVVKYDKFSQIDNVKNTNNIVYHIKFNKPVKIACLELKHSIVPSNKVVKNSMFMMDIHYDKFIDQKDSDRVKLNRAFMISNHNLDNVLYKNVIYLPNVIVTRNVYLSISRDTLPDLNNNTFKFDKLQDVILHGPKNGILSGNRKMESFNDIDGIDDMNTDQMCPNMETINQNLQIADSICNRIEQTDRIKNEKIKFERNKQYIIKLKQQEDEIRKLEKVIDKIKMEKNLRDKENDEIRLARLQKQKRDVAYIKDLANKRRQQLENNSLNFDINLQKEEAF